jgi:hypothetical protein
MYGELPDHLTPSSEYLSLEAEQVEANEPEASALDAITSKKDATVVSLQSSIDATGHVRVTKVSGKGALPTNTEEYRTLVKLGGNS